MKFQRMACISQAGLLLLDLEKTTYVPLLPAGKQIVLRSAIRKFQVRYQSGKSYSSPNFKRSPPCRRVPKP